jgi:hypothetical protein
MENRRADLNDLYKELWLRKRNSGNLVWITKDGKEIPIKDMTDEHLERAIKRMVEIKEYNDIAAEYEASIDTNFG